MDRIICYMVIENIVTLLLACTMTALFFYLTSSLWAFLWLLVLANLNTITHEETTTENDGD